MKFVKFLTSLMFILVSFTAKSENPCGTMYPSQDSTSWGIGFIRMPVNKNVAIKGITEKNGQTCYIGNGEIVFNNYNKPKINQSDIVYLGGFDYVLLKVYQIKDTKYKICLNSIEDEDAIWVDFDEFSSKNLSFITYLSFIDKNKNYFNYNENHNLRYINIGINLLHSGLHLRTEPSIEGQIVTTLRNNLEPNNKKCITHLEVLYVNGNWAQVMAREYVYDAANDDANEGCSLKVVKEYLGFLQVIDETGRPNIWYAVTSY